MTPQNHTIRFLLLLTGVFGVAFIGYLGTARGMPVWYGSILRPAWSPPDWVFGPVWTVLYLMIAFAGWAVLGAATSQAKTYALVLFWTQLALNALWSWLFFGFGWIGTAFAEILLLLAVVVATAVQFFKINRRAGLLLVPYALWLMLATALSYSIWSLNRADKSGLPAGQATSGPGTTSNRF